MNNPEQGTSAEVAGAIAPGILSELGGTRVWIRLATVVIGIVVVLTLLNVGSMMTGAMGPTMIGIVLAPNLVAVALYVVLGVLLHRYASAISRATASRSATDVETALEQQRRFWKVAGILTIAFIVIGVVGIVAGIVIGVIGVMGQL
ncbi:MAG: hypothetical protein ACR2RL_22310 [Gammaproteobacteria bacterium]